MTLCTVQAHRAPAARAPFATHLAVVIGNSNYTHLSDLPNSAHDATDMTAVFQQGGYDHVVTLRDASRGEMEAGIASLAARITSDCLIVLYYAGHGVLTTDYHAMLVPVDVVHDNNPTGVLPV